MLTLSIKNFHIQVISNQNSIRLNNSKLYQTNLNPIRSHIHRIMNVDSHKKQSNNQIFEHLTESTVGCQLIIIMRIISVFINEDSLKFISIVIFNYGC